MAACPLIRLATRGSALALAQATLVGEALHAKGVDVELAIIETEGDRRVPDTAWGEGAFVAAIERALLDGRADAAVHSAKDMPTDETPGLTIAAYLPRADPRDVLVARRGEPAALADLPRGARVGTDSPRRTAFVLAARPDLRLHPLHGNVDTRLRRLDAGDTDALVLAAAGLMRLGRDERIGEALPPEVATPAPGQGAIAVQVRATGQAPSDRSAADAAADTLVLAVARIDHRPTRLAVEAERAFLAAMGGGCRAPIGALAHVEGGDLSISVAIAEPDGSWVRRETVKGPADASAGLVAALVARLRADVDGRSRGRRADRPRVLITRDDDRSGDLVAALRAWGADPVVVPTIAVSTVPDEGELVGAFASLCDRDWVVITSANGASAVLSSLGSGIRSEGGPRWAAVGAATAQVLRDAGLGDVFVPGLASGEGVGRELPLIGGERVLLARSDLASPDLPAILRARGATVTEVVGYRTLEGPEASRPLLAAALEGTVDVVVFTSGSTVRGFLRLLDGQRRHSALRLPAVCIGGRTAAEATAAGFRVVAVAATADSMGIARAVQEALEARGHPKMQPDQPPRP